MRNIFWNFTSNKIIKRDFWQPQWMTKMIKNKLIK